MLDALIITTAFAGSLGAAWGLQRACLAVWIRMIHRGRLGAMRP